MRILSAVAILVLCGCGNSAQSDKDGAFTDVSPNLFINNVSNQKGQEIVYIPISRFKECILSNQNKRIVSITSFSDPRHSQFNPTDGFVIVFEIKAEAESK